jgi:hypothetical protein
MIGSLITGLKFAVALVKVGGELGEALWHAARPTTRDYPESDDDEGTNVDKLRGQAAGSANYAEAKRAEHGR